MFSIPPTTTTWLSPAKMDCVPSMIAFIPEAHTLFTVVQGTFCPKPAPSAACRAGACPTPACKTFPMKTSSIHSELTFPFSKAPLIAMEPSLVAGTLDNAPINEPIGVLAAATM